MRKGEVSGEDRLGAQKSFFFLGGGGGFWGFGFWGLVFVCFFWGAQKYCFESFFGCSPLFGGSRTLFVLVSLVFVLILMFCLLFWNACFEFAVFLLKVRLWNCINPWYS